MAQEATSKQGEGGAEGASGDAAQKLPVTLSALLALGTVKILRDLQMYAVSLEMNYSSVPQHPYRSM